MHIWSNRIFETTFDQNKQIRRPNFRSCDTHISLIINKHTNKYQCTLGLEFHIIEDCNMTETLLKLGESKMTDFGIPIKVSSQLNVSTFSEINSMSQFLGSGQEPHYVALMVCRSSKQNPHQELSNKDDICHASSYCTTSSWKPYNLFRLYIQAVHNSSQYNCTGVQLYSCKVVQSYSCTVTFTITGNRFPHVPHVNFMK